MNSVTRASTHLEANVYDISCLTVLRCRSMRMVSTSFGEDKFHTYRLQSVFVTNFLDENSYLGTNHYIGYFSDKMTFEAGEVNGWGRSLLSGRGFKASYTLGRNTIGAMIVRSPYFFRSHRRKDMVCTIICKRNLLPGAIISVSKTTRLYPSR